MIPDGAHFREKTTIETFQNEPYDVSIDGTTIGRAGGRYTKRNKQRFDKARK